MKRAMPNVQFGIYNFTMRLVLASASPRRAELLRAAGLEFEILVVDVNETIRAGETPVEYVHRVAADKSARALSVLAAEEMSGRARNADLARRMDDVAVLGADTAVVVDNEIMGKPRDDREAAAMLRRLSGRRHDVLTGVSLRQRAVEIGRTESTAVYFAPLTDAEIAWYVNSGEGRDKAGAYAIQGLASSFVPRIEGSYSNVVGLPVACVYELLQHLGGLSS